MNWVDYLVVGLICLSGLMSGYKGIVKELFGLCILTGSGYLSFTFMNPVASWFQFFENAQMRQLVAGTVLFMIGLLVGGLFLSCFQSFINKIGLGGTDSLLGMLFGLVRGVGLSCVVATALHHLTTAPFSEGWQTSLLMPVLLQLSEIIWLKISQWPIVLFLINQFLQ